MPRPQNLGLVSHSIPAADWLKVIDVVNRLNMAVDYWDVDAILEVYDRGLHRRASARTGAGS